MGSEFMELSQQVSTKEWFGFYGLAAIAVTAAIIQLAGVVISL